MPNELSSILRDIVSKAAKAPTGNTGEIARLRKRYEGCSDVEVVLVDCSGSMASCIGSQDLPKIEHARIALTDLLSARPLTVIIAFGSYAKTINSPNDLSDCMGGTNLGAAIEEVAKLKPRRTVIISDGLPDSESSATEAVGKITGRVDAIYCGPDGHPAVAFLQSLTRIGGGQQMTYDGYRELSPMICGLLGA